MQLSKTFRLFCRRVQDSILSTNFRTILRVEILLTSDKKMGGSEVAKRCDQWQMNQKGFSEPDRTRIYPTDWIHNEQWRDFSTKNSTVAEHRKSSTHTLISLTLEHDFFNRGGQQSQWCFARDCEVQSWPMRKRRTRDRWPEIQYSKKPGIHTSSNRSPLSQKSSACEQSLN